MGVGDTVKLAPWHQCSLNALGYQHTIEVVRLQLDTKNGQLTLTNPIAPPLKGYHISTYLVPFAHPPTCPFLALGRSHSHGDVLARDLHTRGPIKVGVSVLIEDKFGRVFLTKRASTMRIFPSLWVLPGGHMEAGESFIETGRRELLEETGIDLTSDDDFKVFGAFESTYPQLLANDVLPNDHHIVVFAHIKLRTHEGINVKLAASEVDVAAWVPKSSLAHLLQDKYPEFEFKGQPKHNYAGHLHRGDDSTDDFETYYPANAHQSKDDNLKQLFYSNQETISHATVYILKQYLNNKPM
eukprot:gene1364-1564_t